MMKKKKTQNIRLFLTCLEALHLCPILNHWRQRYLMLPYIPVCSDISNKNEQTESLCWCLLDLLLYQNICDGHDELDTSKLLRTEKIDVKVSRKFSHIKNSYLTSECLAKNKEQLKCSSGFEWSVTKKSVSSWT